MNGPTPAARRMRDALARESDAIGAILQRYGAANLRVFGSVARGDSTEASDLDLLVDLAPGRGNELLRVSGIAEELTALLGVKVDVVAEDLLRAEVSKTALHDAVAV